MKRYALFFIFICISLANIALPNSIPNNEKKEKHEALKKEMLGMPGEAVAKTVGMPGEAQRAKTGEFDNKFDLIIGVDSLKPLGLKNALLLKNLCHEYLLGFLNKFPSVFKKDMKKVLEKEGAFCIATFARVKSSYDYKQQTTRSLVDKFIGSGKPMYNKNTKREIGKKAYQKTLSQIALAAPGSLAYLVNEPIKNDIFAKTRELCARRLFG